MGDHSLSALQKEDLLEDLKLYHCLADLGAALHCERDYLDIFSCRKTADLCASVQ